MEKFRDKLPLSFGALEICDFPQQPTSFEQYPTGRLVIGDRYNGDIIYYRLKVHLSVRNRGIKGVDFGALKNELLTTISTYVEKVYGEPKRVHGWSHLYTYLEWFLAPNPRNHGQRPGTRLTPLGADRGYEMYIELPNFIFFTMLPRIACRELNNPQGKAVTFMSRQYEEYREFITADTVAHSFPRDGYFGWMVFDRQPHFFIIQVPDLARWNRIPSLAEFESETPFEYERRFTNSMDEDTLSNALHREISKQFTFMRPGTIGKPRDIQVLFKLSSRVNKHTERGSVL